MSKGAKFDTDKLRYDLLPVEAIESLVAVLTMGAEKYTDRNWEKGINYGRVYAAAQRHLKDFWKCEDTDEESGLPHLAHAVCNVMFLLQYSLFKDYNEFDDRPKKRNCDDRSNSNSRSN